MIINSLNPGILKKYELVYNKCLNELNKTKSKKTKLEKTK